MVTQHGRMAAAAVQHAVGTGDARLAFRRRALLAVRSAGTLPRFQGNVAPQQSPCDAAVVISRAARLTPP